MLQPTYSFEDLKLGSQLVRDLIAEKEVIKPLVDHFFDPDKIEAQINAKDFDASTREILYNALKKQNAGITLSKASQQNLESLKSDNTYTITTGHQLNLMTGPLYSIYKIAQVISLSEKLKEQNNGFNFVPVFWMATEDHDFEEINHIHLFNNKIAWNKTDQENRIAGRIETGSIDSFLAEVEGKFQDESALKLVKQFTAFYSETNNLSEATRRFVANLFQDTGLIVVDGDDTALKALFKPLMKKEVEEEVGFTSVMKTNEYLENNGYHQQVFVRGCNLFFINEDGVRERVRKEDDQFFIGEEPISKEELLNKIDSNPEQFSPNALYRPLYQETILPNLVYLGGGGEIAYWLQLKSLFDAHGLTFPMLRLRNSVLLYRKQQAELMSEHKLDLMDLKLGVDQIVKDIALNNAEQNLQLTDAEAEMLKAKSMVMEKVYKVNKNLETMVEAEFAKMIKTMERIEAKLIKAEKSKHEQVQNKLVRLRDQFFPNNGFQERHENFLPYYLKDDQFIHKILTNLTVDKLPHIKTIEI